MTPIQPLTSVSRRTALAGMGIGALGIFLAAHGHAAFAQDATPIVEISRVGHPFVGAWHWVYGNENRYCIFDVDGTYLEYRPDLGIGIGGWRAIGERTGQLFLLHQTVPEPLARDEVFAPDYVSTGHEFRPGVFLHRFPLVEVDEAGTTMTAGGSLGGTAEARNPDGTIGIAFPDTEPQIAIRLVDAATP